LPHPPPTGIPGFVHRSPAFAALLGALQRFSSAAAAAITAVLLTGCGGEQDVDVCANGDGALTNGGFIFVEDPRSGERVSSGFEV
jgi:hypothetical protein